MDHKLLWAKSLPYHPLWCHLLDTAAVCESLLPRFGGVPDIPDSWLIYLVALQDIGKANPLFQNKDPGLAQSLRNVGFALPKTVERFRHEARTADIRPELKSLPLRRARARRPAIPHFHLFLLGFAH